MFNFFFNCILICPQIVTTCVILSPVKSANFAELSVVLFEGGEVEET